MIKEYDLTRNLQTRIKKKELQFPTQNLIIIHCVLLTETELYTTEKADIS